jgi:putative transcriptional regulator
MRNRLKVLRAEHELTQEALANDVGVSRQAIIAIEAGRYDPSLPLAIRIARRFGRPVEAIFELED